VDCGSWIEKRNRKKLIIKEDKAAMMVLNIQFHFYVNQIGLASIVFAIMGNKDSSLKECIQRVELILERWPSHASIKATSASKVEKVELHDRDPLA
jgi:hypothetical protein